MTLADAQRLSEILVAVACAQQACEHLVAPRERARAGSEVAAALGLGLGAPPSVSLAVLLAAGIATLRRYDGPYNGGSDRMRLLLLSGLLTARLAPSARWSAVALAYVAVQVVLSYTMAGWVKLANPDWRSGRALVDVFAWSTYPVSDGLRAWAARPALLRAAAWAMLAFEAAFPAALLHPVALRATLAAALTFHLINAAVFGLNRFVWAWVASYPLLLWFQQAVIARI